MLDTIRTFVEAHTSGLTDGQFFGFGLLLILAIYAAAYLFLVRPRRDDRVDEAARGIARLYEEVK